MFNWQKDLEELWDFLVEIAEDVGDGLQAIAAELLDGIANDMEEVGKEWQLFWEDEPDGELSAGPDAEPLEFDLDPANWIAYEPTRAATPDHQPACMGCRYYHGSTFGGNLLVCGFHPYGWDGPTCPDWATSEPDDI